MQRTGDGARDQRVVNGVGADAGIWVAQIACGVMIRNGIGGANTATAGRARDRMRDCRSAAAMASASRKPCPAAAVTAAAKVSPAAVSATTTMATSTAMAATATMATTAPTSSGRINRAGQRHRQHNDRHPFDVDARHDISSSGLDADIVATFRVRNGEAAQSGHLVNATNAGAIS
jgi:hypothetical protein